jgi:hypothetical protein
VPPGPWSQTEIEATVAAYFAMLRRELAGQPYRKAEYNRQVQQQTGRSRAAFEYKFQNISAVLINHGQAYVRGYLPAQNYQRALETSVLEWVAGKDDLVEVASSSPLLDSTSPTTVQGYSDILSGPPEPGRAATGASGGAAVTIDFVRRDAENRALGVRGEELVLELERRRLHDEEHRPDLAKRVRWSARDEGDGLGYDITSAPSADK